MCGKNFNNNKYIELYEDSKSRKEKNEELIRKIEKDCGYTFAPKVMHKKIDLTNKNNYMILNEKKDKEKKIQKNKSFCYSENNKNNKYKNINKSEKNKASNKLTTDKKPIINNIKIFDNNNGKKANKILK